MHLGVILFFSLYFSDLPPTPCFYIKSVCIFTAEKYYLFVKYFKKLFVGEVMGINCTWAFYWVIKMFLKPYYVMVVMLVNLLRKC